jgi:hypothetical protein
MTYGDLPLPEASGDKTQHPTEPAAALALSDDDLRVLRDWQTNLIVQDDRYDSKLLLSLAARSMVDPAFRERLVSNTAAVLADLQERSNWHIPDGLEILVFENTPERLVVVLPPPTGQLQSRPSALVEFLRSRTDTVEAGLFGSDDRDFTLGLDAGFSPTGTGDRMDPSRDAHG